jgi:hypothetical protein
VDGTALAFLAEKNVSVFSDLLPDEQTLAKTNGSAHDDRLRLRRWALAKTIRI